MTLSIKTLNHYVECQLLFIAMLSVVMLNVITLSVITLSVVKLSVMVPLKE